MNILTIYCCVNSPSCIDHIDRCKPASSEGYDSVFDLFLHAKHEHFCTGTIL